MPEPPREQRCPARPGPVRCRMLSAAGSGGLPFARRVAGTVAAGLTFAAFTAVQLVALAGGPGG